MLMKKFWHNNDKKNVFVLSAFKSLKEVITVSRKVCVKFTFIDVIIYDSSNNGAIRQIQDFTIN